jgi:hypothetical protein
MRKLYIANPRDIWLSDVELSGLISADADWNKLDSGGENHKAPCFSAWTTRHQLLGPVEDQRPLLITVIDDVCFM